MHMEQYVSAFVKKKKKRKFSYMGGQVIGLFLAYGSSQVRSWIELQLLAYTTATATWNPSLICNLHHSPWQGWILNPLSQARDHIRDLMVPNRICFHFAMTGTLRGIFNKEKEQAHRLIELLTLSEFWGTLGLQQNHWCCQFDLMPKVLRSCFKGA